MATAAINPNTPYGLQPTYELWGAQATFRLRRYFYPASSNAALYIGDPVIKVAGSADVNGINGVALATAGDGNSITGVVCGILGIATAGTGNTPSFWPPSNPGGPAYIPAQTTYDYYVLVNDDPFAQWLIQADANYGASSGTAIPVAQVGKNISLKSGTGSVYTGWSGWQADSNTTGTGSTKQLRIIGFHTDVKNAALAQYQKLIVELNTSTEATEQVTGI